MKFAVSDSEYIAKKNLAEKWLFRIPGIVGVGLGPKITAGKITRIPSIQVYVEKKLSPADLAQEHLIPSSIDGIATDVIPGSLPIDMSATVSCRSGRSGQVTAVTTSGGVLEITSPDHGLSTNKHVRIFGLELTSSNALPITAKTKDTFTLPPDVQRPVTPIAFGPVREMQSFSQSPLSCPIGKREPSIPRSSNVSAVVLPTVNSARGHARCSASAPFAWHRWCDAHLGSTRS